MFKASPLKKTGSLIKGNYAEYLPSVNKLPTPSAEEPLSPSTNDQEIAGHRKEKFTSPICISEAKQKLIVSIRPCNPERWAILEDYLENVNKLKFADSPTQIERSQVIAMNTSHLAREVLFRPVDLKSCNSSDVKKFEQEITERIREIVLDMNSLEASLDSLRSKLRELSQKDGTDQPAGPDNTHERQNADIKNWRLVAKQHREVVHICACVRLILFQLENATIRYEPKTGFIHMKTKVWFSSEQERDSIPNVVMKVPMFEKYVPVDEIQISSAISWQIICLEEYAQIIRIKDENGDTRVFESLFNSKRHDAFELSVPFDKYPPRMCERIFQEHFANKPPEYTWVSFPMHLDPLALENKARFYAWCNSGVKFLERNQQTGSVLKKIHESKFCLECIEKGRDSCPRFTSQASQRTKCAAKKRSQPKDEESMVFPAQKRKP